MAGAVAERLSYADQPHPPVERSQSALQHSYLRRRVWGGDTSGEPITDGQLADPSDPQPTNRAERRAQRFGHVARAFSHKPPRRL